MSNEFDDNFIAKVQEQLEQLCVERMTKVAITVHNKLSIRTPKDTSQAAAGWNFTLNKKDMSKPEKLTYAERKSGKKILLQPSKPDIQARIFGDKYHLVNAVKHIIYLNEGHSTQAPDNFIEDEIIKAVEEVG